MSTTFTPIEVPMTVSASTEAVRTSLRSGIPYVANGITDPDTKSAGDVLQYNGSAWVASDELTDLKSDISQLSGLSDETKTALLACFANVAWIGDDGQDYYDALYAALYETTWAVTNTLSHCSTSNNSASVAKNGSYSATITAASGYTLTGASVSITMGGTDITASAYNNGTISIANVTGALVITISAAEKTVSSISAVYTQSGAVCVDDPLDSLKTDLVVTATYSDSSTDTVPSTDYTLSGTLTIGTSTITVSYGGNTATFSVSVVIAIFEVGAISKGTNSTTPQYRYAWASTAAARARMTVPILNKGYTFTSTNSSKYEVNAIDAETNQATLINHSTLGQIEAYYCGTKTVGWAASSSVTSSYVWLALKKNDGTEFTNEELADGAAAVITVTEAS